MNALGRVLERALKDLESEGARAAVIGGIAVSVRTEPRFTRAVDLAVSVASDQVAEAIVRGMLARGWRVLAQLEQDATSRLATVRLASPDVSSLVVDLLFASSGVEEEIVEGAEEIEVLEGIRAPVAATHHLLALKILSGNRRTRPQDRVDAVALLGVLDGKGRERARGVLRSIAARGYHRGKDLERELDELLAGG